MATLTSTRTATSANPALSRRGRRAVLRLATLGFGCIYLVLLVLAAPPPSAALSSLALAVGLIAASIVDLGRRVIPDLAVAIVAVGGTLAASWLSPDDLIARLAAGAVAGGVLAGLAEGYRALRGRDGLGYGDVKLYAAGGVWIGFDGLGSVLAIAAWSGLAAALALAAITGQRPAAIAFGPFLALAIWVTWLFGPVTGFM